MVNREVLERHPQILKDAELLFTKGTLIEKTQVLTLLKAVKYLGLA